jgi:hypothetical protein
MYVGGIAFFYVRMKFSENSLFGLKVSLKPHLV